MKKAFLEKFGCAFEDFVELGVILNFLFANKLVNQNIYGYVLNKYEHVVRHLLIEREKYIALQEGKIHDIEQYLYGFKYFYQFPFISYKGAIFLPLPHLVIQSVAYRCFEYGLTWLNDEKKKYKIDSIYSFKYMSKFLIHRDGNNYFCVREDKKELKELLINIENLTCINSNTKIRRKRKKLRTEYFRTNPIAEAFELRRNINILN